jgi:hypothetical protein
MRRVTMRGCILLAAGLSAGICWLLSPPGGEGAAAPAPKRFADFGHMPPTKDYEGRVFRLSQEYPATEPPAAKLPEFLKTDFKKDWRKYLMEARGYCFKGNVLDGDVEDDWAAGEQATPTWFHMPWQHYGPHGREGIHGLTKEAPVQVRQLA